MLNGFCVPQFQYVLITVPHSINKGNILKTRENYVKSRDSMIHNYHLVSFSP